MKPEQIMDLAPGEELDKHLAVIMTDISGDLHYPRPFSTDPLSALELWQFAADAFGSVVLVKSSDGPVVIGEYCGIRDDEDETCRVEVMTANWMESLAKAVILRAHGHYGDFANPAFLAASETPERNLH